MWFDQQNTGYVDISMVRRTLAEYGSMRLSDDELDDMLRGLQPDAQNRVPMEQFRALSCWDTPPPPIPNRDKQRAQQRQPEGSGSGPPPPARARTTEEAS